MDKNRKIIRGLKDKEPILERGSRLWDEFESKGSVEVSQSEFEQLFIYLFSEIAPGDGFKAERTRRGFLVSRW